MRIGIDLGGTKIEGIVLDGAGREAARRRIATPAGDYDGTVEAVAGLVAELAARTGASRSTPVGIGIPGTVSPATGLVKNANSTCLIGKPLDRDLEAAMARPVKLANDANCFAVSEARDGAGQKFRTVFGVILGTGVGGGLVIDAHPLTGANAIAGEWGHNPLPWPQIHDGVDERPGAPCYCGNAGCIETFLSGPALSRDAGGMATDKIAAKVADGDAEAQAAMQRYTHRLARALASVINIFDPDIIVLGGGLSNITALYEDVPRLWQDWVFSDRCDTPLMPNVHGDSGGVRGAAWLWPLDDGLIVR